jgi:hypothetical protein
MQLSHLFFAAFSQSHHCIVKECVNNLLTINPNYVMDTRVLTEIQQAKSQLSTKELFRKKIKVNEEGINHIRFKIAETKEELEAAYHLNYEIYVKNGYMQPSSTGLRFSLFNAMPYTQTFIGAENTETVMAITLFPDSPLGLPMDSLYKQEVDKLRQDGRYVAEIGGLISKVNNQNLFLHLLKSLYLYADKYLQVDDLVATVHPKHSNFHEIILCFERFGAVKSYSYVNDNPAVALRLDLHKFKEYYWNNYPREPLEKDLYHFFFVKNSSTICLPEKNKPVHVWNSGLFQYFFNEKTNFYQTSDQRTKELIQKYYLEYVMA